jgi:hypothetical protein
LKILKGKYLSRDLGEGGRILLKWIIIKWGGGMDNPAQDRGRFQAFVNTIMNRGFKRRRGIS